MGKRKEKFLRHFEELIEQLGPVKFRRLADEAYDAHGNGDALPSVEETSKQEGANVASCILLLGGVQSTRNGKSLRELMDMKKGEDEEFDFCAYVGTTMQLLDKEFLRWLLERGAQPANLSKLIWATQARKEAGTFWALSRCARGLFHLACFHLARVHIASAST